MRVLVTGATGFIGREIVRCLLLDGSVVRAVVRNPAMAVAGFEPSAAPQELVPGNIHDPAALQAAMRDVDAVVHLVGIIGETRKTTFERVHVEGTRNVVEAAKAAGVSRIIHMSALGSRSDAVSRYHRSKWAAEEIVRQSGLAFTIFRPSMVYGQRDLFVNLFERMSRVSPVLPVMGSGRGTLQPIRVEDVARCFAKALDETRSGGQTYDLGGPEVLTFQQILEQLMEVTGRRRWLLRIPLPVARLQARLLELVYPLLNRPAPLSRDQLIMLEELTVGDVEVARQLFELPLVTFRDGIAAYLR